MSEYFPELKYSSGRVKVELDLSNFATKADIKNEVLKQQNLLKRLILANLKY